MWIETFADEEFSKREIISSLIKKRCGLKLNRRQIIGTAKHISSLIKKRCGLKRNVIPI